MRSSFGKEHYHLSQYITFQLVYSQWLLCYSELCVLVLSGDCPSDMEDMPPPPKRPKATHSSSSLGSAGRGSEETLSQPGKCEQLSTQGDASYYDEDLV